MTNVLLNDDRTGQFVIAQEAWDCIWEELIPRGKGLKTFYDRPGFVESDYNFSAEMLEEMIRELDRLIDKYSGPEWNTKETANRVIELVVEHKALIQTELNEVNSGTQKLKDSDFLGPKERERRRRLKLKEQGETVMEPQQDYSSYFQAIEKKMMQNKRREMRQLARRTQRQNERLAQRGKYRLKREQAGHTYNARKI